MLSLLTTTAACRGSRCGRGRRGGRGGRPDRPRRGAAARRVHPRRGPRGSRQEVPALPEDEESPQQPGGEDEGGREEEAGFPPFRRTKNRLSNLEAASYKSEEDPTFAPTQSEVDRGSDEDVDDEDPP